MAIILILAMFVVGYFIAVIVTGGMKNSLIGILGQMILGVIISALIFGGIYLNNQSDKESWNNGICPNCSGYYLFVNASRYRSISYYYYQCENCHSILKVNHNFTPLK